MLDIKDLKETYCKIKKYVRKTPIENSIWLSELTGGDISLKMECWQHTGSFKARGAFNTLLTLSEEEKKLGVVAPTAGNHGIGLSFAANKLNIPVNIFLPKDTDKSKLDLLKKLNAKLTLFNDIESARQGAIKASETMGYKFISAYNEVEMIKGASSVGLEILDEIENIDTIIVPVGGGGILSGVSAYIKAVKSKVEIWGVQSENSPTFVEWFKRKEVTDVDLKPSIASGLSGYIDPETITFPIVMENADRIISVSEEDLITGMKFMANKHGQIIEPSGIPAVSAILKEKKALENKKVVGIITGGNISYSNFIELIS